MSLMIFPRSYSTDRYSAAEEDRWYAEAEMREEREYQELVERLALIQEEEDNAQF